ncbi:hypothetical protein GCM10018787_33110 [Streptomyces thermodiastaticus]|nr:hypothetical protein GCM10018787_33110 [Streptomyces thermodiastaticus]
MDWVGNGLGFAAAAGTGILLSRGSAAGKHPGDTLEHCFNFTSEH